MDILEALQNRVSVARLGEPAPTAAQRKQLFGAALRAPDHGQLSPWRFLTIEGGARERLGELFVQALLAQSADVKPEALEKARKGPLRAPLLVVVIACLQAHPKVPELEQLLAAGCAAHGLLLAAHGLGLGAMWRTGAQAQDPLVARGLGLASNERIVGFIYLGSVDGERRSPRKLAVEDFVRPWPDSAIS
ncbi:nitroreductase family protein [Pseudomonas sp. N040]|uniref:nitroreductase family protein n=1 Tax=Pseudomonas sp. N040 TaxID=2785325 RepID=UPI0018A2E64C|nr:nitroreductase family protein [Pseudomonas sp. N040]MBF7729514.1 nitroreductase family protein [Pseudomonas sp. N040]MBW7013154.1 nitroreductase family protein [Pseudomonas sp. N040]